MKTDPAKAVQGLKQELRLRDPSIACSASNSPSSPQTDLSIALQSCLTKLSRKNPTAGGDPHRTSSVAGIISPSPSSSSISRPMHDLDIDEGLNSGREGETSRPSFAGIGTSGLGSSTGFEFRRPGSSGAVLDSPSPPSSAMGVVNGGVVKKTKRRCRPSRKPKTTIVEATSREFLAKVQELTGGGFQPAGPAQPPVVAEEPSVVIAESTIVRPQPSRPNASISQGDSRPEVPSLPVSEERVPQPWLGFMNFASEDGGLNDTMGYTNQLPCFPIPLSATESVESSTKNSQFQASNVSTISVHNLAMPSILEQSGCHYMSTRREYFDHRTLPLSDQVSSSAYEALIPSYLPALDDVMESWMPADHIPNQDMYM